MPSGQAVYDGSAPTKPGHKYTNHGRPAGSGDQNLPNNRLSHYFSQDPYSAPLDAATRHAAVIDQLAAVEAAFKRS
ncbi:hypothetical protein QQS21_000660 [Conoideocrella luteorostrata]|uniref:Uncharacterized protein n=1 Tax=Conoideocrella luteorostrata TaxID=1105319 RepID=A0AAJ0G3W7_9HYPO|nr:hypothetical protein QQS21_000660 [Conoideocrella luteorostrata]